MLPRTAGCATQSQDREVYDPLTCCFTGHNVDVRGDPSKFPQQPLWWYMLPNGMENRLVLNSWKEIADYMGRGVRTVQRYERDLVLPVHRPAGKSRSAVVAFADEIDHWMRQGPTRSLTNGAPGRRVTTNLPEWHRLVANSELLLKRADALKTHMAQLFHLMQETDRRRKLMQSQAAPRKLSNVLSEKSRELDSKMRELTQLMARGGDLTSSMPSLNGPGVGRREP